MEGSAFVDDIANGTLQWRPMMKEFYDPFEKQLLAAENTEKVVIEEEKTGKICPLDGGEVVIRQGKFGKFYACINFPECKYTAPIIEETGYICPKDGGKVIMKKTKTGRSFFGCANYPNCTFAVWNKKQMEEELAKVKQNEAQTN